MIYFFPFVDLARNSTLSLLIQKNLPLPRIVQLCKEYGFSKQESDLFQLMVVIQGSNNSHVLNSMSEEDFLRKVKLSIFVTPRIHSLNVYVCVFIDDGISTH